jgi:hypothetical protein
MVEMGWKIWVYKRYRLTQRKPIPFTLGLMSSQFMEQELSSPASSQLNLNASPISCHLSLDNETPEFESQHDLEQFREQREEE